MRPLLQGADTSVGHHATHKFSGKGRPHLRVPRHKQLTLLLACEAMRPQSGLVEASEGALPGTGFLARPDYIAEYRGTSERICGGVFYAGYDGWQQLGVQALGAVVITVFTGACRCAAGLCEHRQSASTGVRTCVCTRPACEPGHPTPNLPV